jgi:hypothetical protein
MHLSINPSPYPFRVARRLNGLEAFKETPFLKRGGVFVYLSKRIKKFKREYWATEKIDHDFFIK